MLLATYWLSSDTQIVSPERTAETLRRFSKDRDLAVSASVLKQAADHLNGALSKGDVDRWVTMICFWSHPHTLWNFMLDTVAAADNDDHLGKIAASLAEHILAHYGSMIPLFEMQAFKDKRFKRMLTGVWRHRMSDRVWARLRQLQADIPNPLPTMTPLKHGVDYMSEALKPEDRENDDKGRYMRAPDGTWIVRPAKAEA